MFASFLKNSSQSSSKSKCKGYKGILFRVLGQFLGKFTLCKSCIYQGLPSEERNSVSVGIYFHSPASGFQKLDSVIITYQYQFPPIVTSNLTIK
ncbi:hypothetical protein M8J77_021582 [Diaphorina citri]|nr:hypothetical protein M8J77_021582 [Diaphorina citri]